MDAVAMDVVIEAASDCADRERAEALLTASLSAARGPRRQSTNLDGDQHWQLVMRVTAAAPGIKAADAAIHDDQGKLVAERRVTDRSAKSCVGLARAVSAWTQIVLDAELVRAHEEDERRAREASLPAPESRPIKLSKPLPEGERPDQVQVQEGGAPPSLGRFEIGSTLFLRNGAAASGGLFGIAPFVTITVAETWVLRPSVMYGTSTSRVPADQVGGTNFSSLGGRFDVCRRMPGNYIDRRGIEFDACLGGDVASVWSSEGSIVRGSVGPSAVLRGELAHDIGLEIRPLLGVALNRTRFLGGELPPFVAGIEFGVSARFP
jgi:hypothetical protein